jgi:hypothetical protein
LHPSRRLTAEAAESSTLAPTYSESDLNSFETGVSIALPQALGGFMTALIRSSVALLALTAVACGDTITQPAPITTNTAAVPQTPPGGPAPPSPTPTPTPPPVPAPPVPTPPPGQGVDYYDALVGTAFWTGEALFGDRLVIEVWGNKGEVWLHSTRLWIAQRNEDSVIATNKDPNDPAGGTHTLTATLNFKSRQWSFNGLAGSGGGTMTLRESK